MAKTTLEQWRMLKAVVEAGSFNKAAERVHKSVSSIHHAVAKLEETLGIPLLHSEGRQTVLTSAGEYLLKRGAYLLNEIDQIEAVAKGFSHGLESELTIAVDGAFPQTPVFHALAQTAEQYPSIKFHIIDTVLSGSNELIEKNKADIALSPFPMADQINDELCVIEFIAVAHKDHPLHHMNHQLDYHDLKSYRQIIVRDSAQETEKNAGWLEAEQRWTVSNLRSSVELICQNMGFSWLPKIAIQPYIDTGLIKPLSLKSGQARHVSFYLNLSNHSYHGQVANYLISRLKENITANYIADK